MVGITDFLRKVLVKKKKLPSFLTVVYVFACIFSHFSRYFSIFSDGAKELKQAAINNHPLSAFLVFSFRHT